MIVGSNVYPMMRYAMKRVWGAIVFVGVASSGFAFAADKAPAKQPAESKPAQEVKTKGFVTVVCNPSCDEVIVDGRSLGPSPVVRAEVASGTHKVLLKRKSQADTTMQVEVKAGELAMLKANLAVQKAPPKEPPPEIAAEIAARRIEKDGFISVVCEPGCDQVILDDTRKLGPAPHANVAVLPGKHQVLLKLKGAPDKLVAVMVVAGQTTSFRASMTPEGTAAKVDAEGAALRAKLEPKVWSGKASADEIRMLKALCKEQEDRACRDRAAAMLKQLETKPQPKP